MNTQREKGTKGLNMHLHMKIKMVTWCLLEMFLGSKFNFFSVRELNKRIVCKFGLLKIFKIRIFRRFLNILNFYIWFRLLYDMNFFFWSYYRSSNIFNITLCSMFMSSCKRLRIMKGWDARGLGGATQWDRARLHMYRWSKRREEKAFDDEHLVGEIFIELGFSKNPS